MSIINDALKKADRLKKWKNSSEPELIQAVTELQQPSDVTENAALEPAPLPKAAETIESLPAPKETTVSISQPPFKVTFTKSQQEKKPTHFSLAKIIFIVFVACGFFVLLIGPWISMMLNRSIAEISSPALSGSKPISVKSEPAVPEPVHVVESVDVPPPAEKPNKSYKSYSSPNVGVSVKPVPRTVQQRESELVFKLTGISILSDSDRIAFINGKVVAIGDEVADSEVTDIQEKQVVLKRGGRFFTLVLES